MAFPRFGGRLNMFVIVAVGPVGAVGNAQRFPSGCGNRGSDFRRCGSFHGPGGEPPSARLLVGSTAGGETAPSYLTAAACGLPEPIRHADALSRRLARGQALATRG